MAPPSSSKLADTAAIDLASIAPFPNSCKIYVQGSRSDIQVPMREISLTPTATMSAVGVEGSEENAPVRVYDTSGSYSDPAIDNDVREGLTSIRANWIAERDDTLRLPNESSLFTRERLQDPETVDLRVAHVPPDHGRPEQFSAHVIKGTDSCAVLVMRSLT